MSKLVNIPLSMSIELAMFVEQGAKKTGCSVNQYICRCLWKQVPNTLYSYETLAQIDFTLTDKQIEMYRKDCK